MRWSNARTRVGNVANVEKMRKFEPMRLRTLDKRHKFENRSMSPRHIDLNDSSMDEEESPEAETRHAESLLRVRNASSNERSIASSPDKNGPYEGHQGGYHHYAAVGRRAHSPLIAREVSGNMMLLESEGGEEQHHNVMMQ